MVSRDNVAIFVWCAAEEIGGETMLGLTEQMINHAPFPTMRYTSIVHEASGYSSEKPADNELSVTTVVQQVQQPINDFKRMSIC
jgi:hypothetical protein